MRAGPQSPDVDPHARAAAVREEGACRARLAALGASFEDQAPVGAEGGCRVDRPLLLSRLAPEIGLRPAAVVNCAMAEALARFAKDVVAPAALSHFGQPLAGIGQASGYVCRPRNGSDRMSEHAFANAIDLSAFVLADGRTIPVEASSDRAAREFLRHLRGRACGPFRTVLGPGSNADHADHLHLDLAARRGGATWCR